MIHEKIIAGAVPELIDIGANLAHESFRSDLPAVLARAEHQGIHRIIVTGTSLESTQAALALHDYAPHRLHTTAGLHPHHASDMNAGLLAGLAELAARPAVVAVGECGLDYFRDLSPRPAQIEAFHRQLELAAKVRKPVFLHQRDAHGDFAAIVKEHRPSLVGGVAHCFTGSAQEAAAYLEMDLAIGITGWICDERRGTHLLPLMRDIPRGRLMIETDAPYLLPRSLKPAPPSRRNEPAFLIEVARVVAAARGESLAELAAHTTAAAEAFFGLERRSTAGTLPTGIPAAGAAGSR